MLRTLVISVILVSGFARAESFAFLGTGVRFDSDASGTSTTRSYPIRIGGGHSLTPKYTLGLDLSRYVTNSNAGSVDIMTEHHELLPWFRGSLWDSPTWFPYASFILGVQQKTITTTFQNDRSVDTGKFEWIIGLGIGSFNHISEKVGAGFEIRGLYRPWASPRYSGDFIATIGWIF